MTPPAIVLDAVTCRHGRELAVERVSGRLLPGSLTAVVGPNGAGKTTLLRALAGVERLAGGRIDRGGLPADRIGWLAQASRLDRSFPVRCGDVVALGAWGAAGPWRRMARDALLRTEAALARVGLMGFAPRMVGALSAGQFQRLLFARLIVQDAPVVLLDEPFTGVDARTEADLLTLVEEWHQEGRTVAAVLHDLHTVLRHFPQTLLLARGVVAWGATPLVLGAENRARARLIADAWAATRAAV